MIPSPRQQLDSPPPGPKLRPAPAGSTCTTNKGVIRSMCEMAPVVLEVWREGDTEAIRFCRGTYEKEMHIATEGGLKEVYRTTGLGV